MGLLLLLFGIPFSSYVIKGLLTSGVVYMVAVLREALWTLDELVMSLSWERMAYDSVLAMPCSTCYFRGVCNGSS